MNLTRQHVDTIKSAIIAQHNAIAEGSDERQERALEDAFAVLDGGHFPGRQKRRAAMGWPALVYRYQPSQMKGQDQ